MDKHNIDRDDRTDFILGFLSRDFTLDEVVAFIKDRIVLDEKQVIQSAWKAKARQLVSSFKDGDGVRLIAAYDASPDNEPRRMVYQVIASCNDPKVLDKQIINMTKNRDGSEKLIKKARDRKEHLSKDADLFNFMDFDIEEGASQ